MPDPQADVADQLRRAAAAAVTALPGVVRLEPTLSNALRRLHNATGRRAISGRDDGYSAADGIRLTRHGNLVDIHVDVTINTGQPADLTARTVHQTLEAAIAAHQLTAGNVTVTVLRLQP